MQNINNLEELDSFILKNTNKVTMIYFGAVWCNPCNQLKKRIEKDHSEMPNLAIGYIDCDNEETKEVCDDYEIKMLPSLVFVRVKNMEVKIIGRVDGYDWVKIVMTYNEINEKYYN